MQSPWAILLSVACPARNIFPHYLINGTIFERKLLSIKCVSVFSTKFVWNISHSKKNWARYDKKFILTVMSSTRHSFIFYWNLNFLVQFSKDIKISNFLTAHSEGSSCCMRTDRQTGKQTDRQTDRQANRHSTANSPFSPFCERVQKCSENWYYTCKCIIWIRPDIFLSKLVEALNSVKE
jgi:hypothetical protein